MSNSWYLHREVLPFMVIVVMECTNVALNTLFKLAANHGMSRHVFIVYAYAVAAFVLLPSPFFSRRSRTLPPLTLKIMLKIFLLGVVGYTSQIMGYTGINYGSPTLASAMSNLAPAYTFVLAIILRMEKISLSSKTSRAKILGTIVSISGAFVVTFYKGPSIDIVPKPSSASNTVSLQQSLHLSSSSQSNWIIGSLFLSVEYFLVPVWYIIQAYIMKDYPAELTVVFFYTAIVSILGAIVGAFAETDSSKWALRPNIALASFLCSGVFGCCINNAIHTWAIHLRGPFYVAMFKPLSIAIAAAMGVVILGDTFYLGSIIGSIIIAIGFYTVMWGKAKEDLVEFVEVRSVDDLESSAVQKQHPLLQDYNKK